MRRILLVLSLASLTIAAFTEPSAAVSPQDSVSNIHKVIVTPASDALFKAESSPPTSDREWAELERNAASLAKSATQLTSKGASNGGSKNRKQWQNLSRALVDAANLAVRAAKAKNANALIEANGRIVAVCEACHDEYRDGGHGMTSDKPSASL